MRLKTDFVVVGAGAAGAIAAYTAAKAGVKVILIEKNKSIGRKLAITGAGRCNLTNSTDINGLVANVPGNGRFLYSAFQRFGPEDLMNLFENELGVSLKVERGNRVFPTSDEAREIVESLYHGLKKVGVEILTETKVTGLLFDQTKANSAVASVDSADLVDSSNQVKGVTLEGAAPIQAQSVLIATGGLSYPATGCTGDGYKWAEAAGHQIMDLQPSLIPLETKETWVRQTEGLSLINVRVTSLYQGKTLQSEFGEMIFTKFGISGPVILSLSREIVPLVLKTPHSVVVSIDLKPALTDEELDQRVQRDFASVVRKIYKNALDELLPQKIIPVMIELSGIDPQKPVHQITKEERFRLVYLLKNLQLTISRPRPIAEAIVTAGGINVKEINPKTMESKIVPGLYFAGELVDLDGYTGGFNLQIAFSTGYLAGNEVARRVSKQTTTIAAKM